MSEVSGGGSSDRAAMVHAAKRYYLDDVSKVLIAEELGLSRFKVARLLEQARRDGVVTITIQDAGLPLPDLSAAVAAHLGLREALVVEAGRDEVEIRREVGRAAAMLLGRTLHEGDVLGLAWGRTLTEMSSRMPPLPRVDVVQLTGAIGTDLDASPVEVVRRVALQSGGSALPIFAPLVVDDPATADGLRRQPDVARALRMFERVTTAVVSVGSWDPPNSQLLSALSERERAELLALGVRAEIATILVSDDGEVLAPEFARRCLTVDVDQLRRVRRVVAAAGGTDKAQAVAAIARAGLISELVTDRTLAEGVLALPRVERAPR